MNLKKFFKDRKTYFWSRQYQLSLIAALVMFFLVLVINYFAGIQASNQASNHVEDIILSNTNVLSVTPFFVVGSTVFWIFSMLVYITHLQKIPFTFKAASLFIFIRSIFINLTHIGPFPDAAIIPSSGIISYLAFEGDLFFSGHTGFPLLMAFIFWESKFLRYSFISWTIYFAVVVLLGHLHYTIDVASAVFITYTIFHLAQKIFKRDLEMAEGVISEDHKKIRSL